MQRHKPNHTRHTIRAAQEAGTPHHGYIERKKENIIFTPLYLGDTLSDWDISLVELRLDLEKN